MTSASRCWRWACPRNSGKLRQTPSNDAELVERERDLLGFTHFDLGAELLARWNCPQMVQEAVWSCESAEAANEHPPNLGAIVKTASLLADANGVTTFDIGEDSELQLSNCWMRWPYRLPWTSWKSSNGNSALCKRRPKAPSATPGGAFPARRRNTV